MKAEIYSLTTLHHLLDYDARKLAGAEAQLESILESWIAKVHSSRLITALQSYLSTVREHIQLLSDFLNEEQLHTASRTNFVMESYITETREQVCNCLNQAITDATILAGVRVVIHYKISLYAALATFCKSLANPVTAKLFSDALLHENQMDETLAALAALEINPKAVAS